MPSFPSESETYVMPQASAPYATARDEQEALLAQVGSAWNEAVETLANLDAETEVGAVNPATAALDRAEDLTKRLAELEKLAQARQQSMSPELRAGIAELKELHANCTTQIQAELAKLSDERTTLGLRRRTLASYRREARAGSDLSGGRLDGEA